jgi:RNA:NAD 2'-phosphotransferase (TPT1/KptA family)
VAIGPLIAATVQTSRPPGSGRGVDVVRRSKRLSSVLRHAPDSAGLTLDAAGWVDVDALLAALDWTRAELARVVATNDKRRFALDDTGTRLRAGQGHSVAVDLGHRPRVVLRVDAVGRAATAPSPPARRTACGWSTSSHRPG